MLIGVFVIIALVMVNSQADSVSTTTVVGNVAPTVESVFISSTANAKVDSYAGGAINDLTAGGATTIHINGVVQDLNGRDDITGVSASFRRSGIALNTCDNDAGVADAPDNNNCYLVPTCTLTNNANTDQKEYDCAIAIQYYADATDAVSANAAENWVVLVDVTDGTASAQDTSLTKEMETMMALTIPSSINYGTLALGATTSAANNQEQTISQAGNDVADVNVSGTVMTCDIRGSIAVGNQEWALTDVPYGDLASTDLTGLAVDTNLGVPLRTSDTVNTSKILYWNIGIPSSGVEGTCTGTNTITAIVG